MERQDQIRQIQLEYIDIKRVLDERSLRWWCASKSRAYNRIYKKGGVSIVSLATGISRSRIQRGLKEMELENTEDPTKCVRTKGGGRKKNNGKTTKTTKQA